MKDLWKGIAILGIWVGVGAACYFIKEAGMIVALCGLFATLGVACAD